MQTLCKLLLYLSLHKTIGPLWVRTFILSLKHIPSRHCLNAEYSYNISILSLSILFHVLPTIYNEGTWTSLIPIRVIPYLTDCRFFLRWVLTCGLWRKCPLGVVSLHGPNDQTVIILVGLSSIRQWLLLRRREAQRGWGDCREHRFSKRPWQQPQMWILEKTKSLWSLST